jgi:DNA primase
MPFFTKESLETLRQRIDLVGVLSGHIDLKKAGASYKGLCPFHDEKTPSFTIQKGDHHYHCFGCGAHGDAISFLMSHVKMNFSEAVESLAQRFHVNLELAEETATPKGPNKALLKEALEQASRVFHFALLHMPEGKPALEYLYQRDIDLDFIHHFQIGFAPKISGFLRKILHTKFVKDEVMAEVGLISPYKEGGWKDFFQERITFPIRDASGAVIGFSARKFREETFGGKYVNTPETPLFKKSRVLFGLNYSRKRIIKERKAIIVEGQVDALRLIQAGFNITVAGQGTAFGEGQARELISLGVSEVFLALDPDEAGREATVKVGDLFQRQGVEVRVVQLPAGEDPDHFLRTQGSDAFIRLLETSEDYLSFLVAYESRKIKVDSPAGKNELVQVVSRRIREWDQPLLVHESLKKLARLTQVPEEMIGVDQTHVPNLYIRKIGQLDFEAIDPDRILEIDFLRWLILCGESHPNLISLAKLNIAREALKVPACHRLYATYLDAVQTGKPLDILSLVLQSDEIESQQLIKEITQKKINRERVEQQYIETVQKILDRNWMQAREEVKMKIKTGECSEDEVLELVRQFEMLKKPSIRREDASRLL